MRQFDTTVLPLDALTPITTNSLAEQSIKKAITRGVSALYQQARR